jgi:hypothetical protein
LDAWYFAGDFVDSASDLGNPELYGVAQWRARTRSGGLVDDGDFWRLYVPIMSRLFAARAK